MAYALVELAGRDPDDWPELTPEGAREFERRLGEAEPDDLLDAVDLDGERVFGAAAPHRRRARSRRTMDP